MDFFGIIDTQMFLNCLQYVKIKFHVFKLMKVEMISWKKLIHMQFYFDIVEFKEPMRIY
jgi:hypothetical protein